MAAPKSCRPLPALASGQTPQPGVTVVTLDGHHGAVLWTTPRINRTEAGKASEATHTDPDYWTTLVRLDGGTAHRYTTGTLTAAEAP